MAKSWGELNLTGQGGNRCKCSVCGEVFSTVRNFDAHRDVDYRRPGPGKCVDPETMGLVLSEKSGVWVTPQEFRNKQ